jgi:hypothetical protein
MARFMENHDEPRAAAAFPPGAHQASAVVTYLSEGMRFFHQGQFAGRLRRIPMQIIRAPEEPVDPEIRGFYDRLLGVLRMPVVRSGEWRLLECEPAWDGNGSSSAFIAFAWDGAGARLVVCVNLAGHSSQCYVKMPFDDLRSRSWRLTDLLGDSVYVRPGDDLTARGLYLDVPAWKAHVFQLEAETVGAGSAVATKSGSTANSPGAPKSSRSRRTAGTSGAPATRRRKG